MLTNRENYLRNATFNHPRWIPAHIHINDASWDTYRGEMEDVVLRHPTFFPGFKKGFRDYDNYDFGPACTKGQPFKDAWGCIWESPRNGLEGIVTNAPLENWEDLENYKVPDALVQADRWTRNWDYERQEVADYKARGELTYGWVPHGFLFMRLQYLRGFENCMIDFATEEPNLQILIDRIVEHNMIIVNNYVNMGVDVMEFGEDLGTQKSTFLSPKDFKRWIAPAYKKLMDPCKKKGILVFLHSDGRTLDILEDQIAAGVDIVNPQDLCNGIDNLVKYIKGKACIRLDIDRQTIVPYGTRKDIHELIEEEVRKLGDPRGGLEFIAGIYPPTPPENVDALCEAIEKYRTYWWD